MTGVVLAVDGGNFKTHLALVGADGALLSLANGPLSSPHQIGVDGCVELLDGLLREASREAGLPADDGAVAEVAQVMLAGADLPQEEEALHAALSERGWTAGLTVANDTFAVLRAGTERKWGVALVCGAGINCVGVGPDGTTTRFHALGAITGDWGGGEDVGLAGLAAAVRAEDGRGPRTTLQEAVPAHFGLATPLAVAEAIHLAEIPRWRLSELAPVVLGAAGDDLAATGIADRLVRESIDLVRVALGRLGVTEEPVDIVLGGGLFHDGRLAVRVAQELRQIAHPSNVVVVDSPPIVGAALLGLDRLDADPHARARAREELERAVDV
jgi:N-acetylglucosamine kinase-like BadF-type ATPase